MCLGIKYGTLSTSHEGCRDEQRRIVAYAQKYLGLATVFRRFIFELYETDISDVDLAHDLFALFPKLNSRGVRVTVE